MGTRSQNEVWFIGLATAVITGYKLPPKKPFKLILSLKITTM